MHSFQPRAEHAGFEITSGQAMDTFENFSKIAEKAIQIYPSGHSLHKEVKKQFEKWSDIASTFIALASMMKSQEKITDDNEFLKLLDEFLPAFDKAFPNRKYFNKLHFLMHLYDFVKRFGFLGLRRRAWSQFTRG